MALSALDKINIGRVSAYLSAGDNARSLITNKVLDSRLPLMLSMESQIIQWRYLSNTSDPLTDTTNYLYQLCGRYSALASSVLSTGSQGVIGVIGGSTGSYSYSVLQSVITAQSTSFTNSALINGQDLRIVLVDNQPISDFTFNSSLGTIYFNTITLYPNSVIIIPFNRIGHLNFYTYASPQFIIAAQSTSFTDPSLVNGQDLKMVYVDNQPVSDFTFDFSLGKIYFNTLTLYPGNKLIIPFNKKI